MLKSKKLICIILCMLIMPFMYTIDAGSAEKFIINSIEVDQLGVCEIVGYCTNAPLATSIAIVVGSLDLFNESNRIISSKFDMDNLVYIAQENAIITGNNGAFIFKFAIDKKYENSTLRAAFGNSNGDYYTTTFDVGNIPDGPGIEIVSNNSVLYGNEIFFVECDYYTSDNIANALKRGGANLYYRIGGKWYDLMSEKATDNSFLVPANSSKIEDVEAVKPICYWYVGEKIELKYALLD